MRLIGWLGGGGSCKSSLKLVRHQEGHWWGKDRPELENREEGRTHQSKDYGHIFRMMYTVLVSAYYVVKNPKHCGTS